jgi:hypothetical protein
MDELYGRKWGFTRELRLPLEIRGALGENPHPCPLSPRRLFDPVYREREEEGKPGGLRWTCLGQFTGRRGEIRFADVE